MKKINRDTIYAWVIGIGIILFAVHNRDLTWFSQSGTAIIFLPTIGLMLSLMTTFMVLMQKWKKITLGSKYIWIPLAVLALCIGVSGIAQIISGEKALLAGITPLLFGVFLFCLYLVARLLGSKIFAPFPYFVVILTISIIILWVVNPVRLNGGIVGERNYDMATGALAFGAIISVSKRQWIIVAIALIGMIFTGAPEAAFYLAIMTIIILARRDWGKRLFIVIGLGCLIILGLYITGYGDILFRYILMITQSSIGMDTEIGRNQLWWKWQPNIEAMKHIALFGHGYTITEFTIKTVHNVPLIIVDQIGILGALAWIFTVIYCLIKTKWKYAFATILILSVFDHYFWTQVAPYVWCLVGIASLNTIKNDLIFKETN